MSSAASADPISLKASDQPSAGNQQSDTIESNHSLPARTMAEGDDHHSTEKYDAATMAASEELKHTTISDKVLTTTSTLDPTGTRREPEDKKMAEHVKENTPDLEPTDAQDEEMKERLSSPKKKRGRDQDDDSKDLEGDKVDEKGSSADGSAVNGSRTERSGPEKKRHRDTSEDPLKVAEKVVEKDIAVLDPPDTSKTVSADSETSATKPTFGSAFSDKPQTSSSAFASSGFSSLAASSTSPFGTIGTSMPSVFAENTKSTTSGFGTLAGAKSPSLTTTPIISGFGGLSADKSATGFGFGGTSTSGFGALGSGSVFGSALGNGFAGGSGPKLSSFAAPGKENIATDSKPARAFGAPETDEEDGSDEEGSDGGADSDEERGEKHVLDDKKKAKVTKVHIEDGEAGEATLLQMRAKLFAIDSKEAGWKERGVGTLKINVPQSCASFDDNGVPIPGSFDASGLGDEDEEEYSGPRVPRLIMRQENTHRVILNTIIVRAMEFKDKPSTSTAQILFTAFEGEKEPKPVNMLLKLSEANARLFRCEIDSIKHEL